MAGKKVIIFKPPEEQPVNTATRTAYILVKHIIQKNSAGEKIGEITKIMRVFEDQKLAYRYRDKMNNNKLLGRNAYFEIVLAPLGDIRV